MYFRTSVLMYFALFGGLFSLLSRIMNYSLKATQKFAISNSMIKKLFTQVDEDAKTQDIKADESLSEAKT